MNKTRDKQGNAAVVITAAAFISIFVYSLAFSLINVIVNEIVDEFSLAGTSQGLMSSIMSLGFMLSLLITPVTQGRVQKLAMLVAAGALQSAALLACGYSRAFSIFCLLCVVLGIGGGFADAYSNSSIVDVSKTHSPRGLGVLHGLFGIGSLLTPPAVYWLLSWTDWRGVFHTLAVIMAAAALAVFSLSRRADRKEVTSATHEKTLNKADLLGYIRNRRNIVLVLSAAFATATQSGVLVWIVRYMAVRFDAAPIGAMSISAFWVCATITRFCVARIKAAPMKLLILGALLSAVFLTIGVASANPFVMCAMMGAMGFAGGHFMPVLFSECASGYAGKTTFTTSVMMFVMGLVRIAIPLVMAFVSAYVSVVSGMMIPAVTALLTVGFGLLTMHEDLKGEPDLR